MKTGHAIPCLVLCLAAGALLHALAAAPGRVAPAAPRSGPGAESRSKSGTGARAAAALWEKLQSLTQDPRNPHWPEVEALLVSLSPAEALGILRYREQQDKDFWSSNGGPFARDLLRQAARDPRALLSFVESTGNAEWYSLASCYCFAAEPDAVLEAIRRFAFPPEDGGSDPEFKRNTLYGSAMAPLCQRDPARALAIAERSGLMGGADQPDYGVARELSAAMSRWAAQSPAAALAFAEKHPRLLPYAFEAWGRADPDAAEAWLRERPERRERVFKNPVPDGKDPMEDILLQYVSQHPDDAARFAERVSDPEEFDRWFTWGMAKKPVEECTAWLRSLPEEKRREACNTILHMGGMDEAGTLAICQAFPEITGNDGARFTILNWSHREPEAVVHFLESPAVPEEARFRLLPDAVQGWARTEPEAAQRYLESLPASEAKGAMLIDASQIIGDGGRDAARDYALALPDLSLRIGACRRIVEDRALFSNGLGSESGSRAQWIADIPDAAVREALKGK